MDNLPAGRPVCRQAEMKSVGILLAKWTKKLLFTQPDVVSTYAKCDCREHLGKFCKNFPHKPCYVVSLQGERGSEATDSKAQGKNYKIFCSINRKIMSTIAIITNTIPPIL